MKKNFEDYKYHTTFTAEARCIPDETKNKLLAVASLEDLKAIIPAEALTEGFEDLLPIAANVCVANLGNKRGDIISTRTALEIYPNFIHKFINIEHDRKVIVGHWANSGLSKFDVNHKTGGGSELLKAETLASTKDPFNISLAGYIYAVAFPDVAKKIIEANDPESDIYLQIGLSWEMAFDSYKLAIGSSNLGESEIISDEKEIEKLSKYLKANKGSGKLEDGRYIYRLIDEGVVPLGGALTFSPAAEVSGVFTTVKKEAEASEETRPIELTSEEAKEKNIHTNEENISHASTANVTTSIPKAMKTLKTLSELKGLNDENKTEYSFANVGNVLEAEIERLAKEHQAKLDSEVAAKADLQKKADEALASVATLQKKVTDLEQIQASAAATARYNDRMNALDEEYELTKPQRKAIASQIRDLDDTAFATWKTDVFEAFASKKQAKVTTEEGGKKETSASTEETDEAKKIAAEALKNATVKKETVANTSETNTSLKDKYRKAFSTDKDGGLEIVTAARR